MLIYSKPKVLIKSNATLAEGPVWNHKTCELSFVDIVSNRFFVWKKSILKSYKISENISCLLPAKNKDTWIYIERILTKGKYHKLGQHVLKANNVLILDFNKYGVLVNKKLLNKDEINNIKFSKNETDNELAQKSFIENFLQSVKQKMYSNRK